MRNNHSPYLGAKIPFPSCNVVTWQENRHLVPEFVFYTQPVFYTQSAVRSPQSVVSSPYFILTGLLLISRAM